MAGSVHLFGKKIPRLKMAILQMSVKQGGLVIPNIRLTWLIVAI